MTDGICTLGNDYVYDQIVALLNSIEFNGAEGLPVCIYPYDDRLDKIKQLIKDRPNVQLFENQTVIDRWDKWVQKIWSHHPTASEQWLKVNGKPGVHRMGTHRRLCAFDGPFERFIYMDADTLLLHSPQPIFDALDDVDWVTYDFQHKDLNHVFNTSTHKLHVLFTEETLWRKSFCSGLYGAKRNVISDKDMEWYLRNLSQGEAEVLYPMAPDQTLLNYFVLRKPISSINLALSLPPEERTGNSVTSSHFTEQGATVLDKGVRLLYLHYIGISSNLMSRLCQNENLDIPYRDTFLHYRYLKNLEERPTLPGRSKSIKPPKLGTGKRLLKKLGL